MTKKTAEISQPLIECKDCKKIKPEEIENGKMIKLLFTGEIIAQLRLRSLSYLGVAGIVKSRNHDSSGRVYSVTLHDEGSWREFLISGIEKIIHVCPTCAKR